MKKILKHIFTISGLLFCMQIAASQSSTPDIDGIWSTTETFFEHPYWTIEELFSCNCTSETYSYLRELLLPENDHLSAQEIEDAVNDHNDIAIAEMIPQMIRPFNVRNLV